MSEQTGSPDNVGPPPPVQPFPPGYKQGTSGTKIALIIGGVCCGCLALLVFGLLLISMLLPMVNRLRNMGVRMKCQQNMKTLGELTTGVSGGWRGPANDKLNEEFYLDLVFNKLNDSPGYLICPATTDEVDPGWETAEETPPYRTDPRNCSYFGPVDRDAHTRILNALSDDPIGGEHFTNHADGVNVLFGDTHVQFYEWRDFGFARDADPTNPFGQNWETQDANIDLSDIKGSDN